MDFKKFKKTGGLIIVLMLLMAFVNPPKDLTDRIKTALNTYRVNYAPEKVYIHHDKPYYMAGELLWLKAYVVDAASLKASERSSVLYVDFLNDQNVAVETLTLPISDGIANGDFILPEDLAEGIYRLAAYTRWMRNFGEETFFQKEIYVLEAKEKNRNPQKMMADESRINLQFFPESGDLIAGIPNEVAFKALGSDGFGLSISPAIFDDAGNRILDFKDSHAGMGSFILQPERDKKYFAKLNFSDGKTMDYPLPEVVEQGYVLHIDEVIDKENIIVHISTNKEGDNPLMLFGIARDKLVYMQKVSLATQIFDTKIPKSSFPNGVVRFTLTMENGEPLAERLVFVQHSDKIHLEISSEKHVYHPREEVKLTLAIAGEQSEPLLTNLSMSVTAEELVLLPKNQENIQTYLLLSSDLKGHIESPGYYFESGDVERQIALRHLMMTQGSRRFDWNSLVLQKFPMIQHNNEMDLNIRGRLVRSNGDPVSKGEALLYLKDQYQTFITTPTNEDGYFAFRGFYFKGEIQVVIQGSDHRGRREDVEVQILERDYLPPLLTDRITLPKDFVTQLPEDYVSSTQQHFHAVETEVWGMELGELLLNEVLVEGRAKIHEPFKLHTRADVVISREQLPVAPSGNILESLQGRVPGLQITRRGMHEFTANIRGHRTPPLYLLDGMPISESTMQNLNQFDINRIEILKSPGAVGIYGGRGGGGVIAFFTDVGYEEVVDLESAKYIIVHQASGFDKTRQFYSPVFETTDYFDYPDLRSTVYWNPSIALKNGDKKELSFFTADIPGIYRVIVEGITNEGKPVRKETTFEVRTDRDG